MLMVVLFSIITNTMVITNYHLRKRKAVQGGSDVVGVKVEMWAHLNSLIDPFFFGRC